MDNSFNRNWPYKALTLFIVLSIFSHSGFCEPYLWTKKSDSQPLSARIIPPKGYQRTSSPDESFAAWLRNLPLKNGNPPVMLFNGQLKENQDAHVAIVDIDVGKKDLQQCADAIIRLRAEYLFATNQQEKICFRFTSGDKAEWARWREGYRPFVIGNYVKWIKKTTENSSYSNFWDYLNEVYRWAGTASISKELLAVPNTKRVESGDVFIKGGFPGHAVLVVDVAEDSKGRRIFLLAQSYMPAQDIHILKNPSSKLSPWYDAGETGDLLTPEWTFSRQSLKRFSNDGCPALH